MRVIPRREWGAKYASAYKNYDAPLPATKVYLHHSVTIAPDLVQPFDDDYKAIRTIEQIGQDRFGWGMSYTNLVTPAGLAFEGHRIDGVGSHTAGLNSTARGICLVGNYSLYAPSTTQEFSVAALLVHGFIHGWWDEPKLDGGHRDLKSTECPGNFAYQRIPYINSIARNLLMADSDHVRDIGWRLLDFLQMRPEQTGGASPGTDLPMVTFLETACWRLEALVNGREEVLDGPTAGETVFMVKEINSIHDKLDTLLSQQGA
jgi:hypothetical protein